ncbi:WecB/TagA/CpsF family glycosyltransferase [Demequina sediminicola]|uniref:WecB/TagA/CpsF family glycosyltransferase n=1 Tax=Demequina sediminicola TaxID=1095026 RepID=UPI00078075F8|nr:WecB/TagA/CpsF family glycosyltransferase [Demequina sediminicola]
MASTPHRVAVGAVPFDVRTQDGAVAEILQCAQDRSPVPIRFANAWCVVLADEDAEYAALLNTPGLNFPDGRPVAKEMRKAPDAGKAEQVRGPSVFPDALGDGRALGIRHYFLGSTPEVIERLTAKVAERFPGAVIVGSYAPPFGPLDEAFYADCVPRIEASDADIVWVGMGTPKQDFAAAELAERTQRPCAGVGAAFDFLAGTTREAPRWMRSIGLEWLFRLLSEPRRLWRRYLIGNAKFLRIARRS